MVGEFEKLDYFLGWFSIFVQDMNIKTKKTSIIFIYARRSERNLLDL